MAKKQPIPVRPPRPEVLAFLEAIKDNPEDDTPRLILADWLQENGDERDHARGEFLRLSCQVERLPPGDSTVQAITKRIASLWQRHKSDWFAPFADLRPSAGERGMLILAPEGRQMTTKAAGELVGTEAFAWVNSVRLLSAGAATLSKMGSLGVLDGLNHLDCSGRKIRSAGAEALAKIKGLARLRSLDLYQNWIDDEGIRALARSPAFTNLRHLNLRRNVLGRGVKALASSPLLRHLKSLNLSYHGFGDGGIADLAGARWLDGVEELDVGMTGMTDRGLTRLVASPGVRSLRRLELGQDKIDLPGVEALANSPNLGKLEQLRFSSLVRLGDETAEMLASLLGRLRVLDLTLGHMAEPGVRAVMASLPANKLRILRLYSGRMNEACLRAIVEASGPSLHEMGLGYSTLTEEMARILTEAPRLDHVEQLTWGGPMAPGAGRMLQQRFGKRVSW